MIDLIAPITEVQEVKFCVVLAPSLLLHIGNLLRCVTFL